MRGIEAIFEVARSNLCCLGGFVSCVCVCVCSELGAIVCMAGRSVCVSPSFFCFSGPFGFCLRVLYFYFY